MISVTKREKSKVISPKIEFENVYDLYAFYVLIVGIDAGTFWQTEIFDLVRIAGIKIAYENWENNPKTR